MLTKFAVSNFKNFNNKLSFDLTRTNLYNFNKECVVKGIVNKALIYGHNGIGKTNLGFALFDLIAHLTDKHSSSQSYTNYLNVANENEIATFRYEFTFEQGIVYYEYQKTALESLISEKLIINGREFAIIDRQKSTVASIDVKGAENLKRDIGTSQISILSYIKKNSVLEDNRDNQCFNTFLDFVNGMLLFRSLGQSNYIGLEQGSHEIGTDIVENGNISNFEKFLNQAGIECTLKVIGEGKNKNIAFDFAGRRIPFFAIASQGTKSLALFYYWLQRLEEKSTVTFLFIDEFDAFYHHDLSAIIIKMLRKINAQVILTTHNTSSMTNDLLRPDCYFLMNNKGIHSLADSTVKELREAHNIEKLYKAGAFSG